MAVKALENMRFWPVLRRASDVATLIDAFSYAFKARSYLPTSYFSLLKYYRSLVVDTGYAITD